MKEKRTAVIESIMLLIFSFGVLFEGLRVTRGAKGVQDVMGPGTYITVLGGILICVTLIHIVSYTRRLVFQKKTAPNSAEKSQGSKVNVTVIVMVAILALYAVLIQVIGYPITTPIFFLLMFWAVGVTSWKRNIMLTATLSATYYVIFVHYCGVIFPRGLFFE